MDGIDYRIAKILCEKSRTPFKKIGEKIGVSTQTVMRRYKKLEKNLFTFSSITVDLEKLGFEASVSLSIKVASNKKKLTKDIFNQLIILPNVIVAFETLGPTDIILMVPIKSTKELFSLMEKISNIEGIQEIDLTIFKGHSSWPRQLYAGLLNNSKYKSNKSNSNIEI